MAWERVPTEEVLRGWEQAGLLKAWDSSIVEEAANRMEKGDLFPKVPAGTGFNTQPVPEGDDEAEGAHADEDEAQEEWEVGSEEEDSELQVTSGSSSSSDGSSSGGSESDEEGLAVAVAVERAPGRREVRLPGKLAR
jgi:hypothetical protein